MSDAPTSVSIVTQTCVRPDSADAFVRWPVSKGPP